MSASVSPPSTFSSDLSDCGDKPRKIAVLGLPWETSEDTLQMYFSQYGSLKSVEILKDKYTGKSRGFGFVTFSDASAADLALASEHLIDGRRCEAKIAYPKGEPAAARTRIFVARIPSTVTEAQFRGYFEKFGKLADAYMPKNHAKQGYRGIGFVTYASPQSVEKVMATKHWLNGQEIALDKATPKDLELSSKQQTQSRQLKMPRSPVDGGMLMNGAFANMPLVAMLGGQNVDGTGFDGEDRNDMSSGVSSALQDVVDLQSNANLAAVAAAALRSTQQLGLGLGLNPSQAAALRELTKDNNSLASLPLSNMDSMALAAQALNQSAQLSQALLANVVRKGAVSPYMQNLLQVSTAGQGSSSQVQQSPNSNARRGDAKQQQQQQQFESPAIANARAGPRLFIGKLTKETSEADVKEYFAKFGYVMDVYLPKAKENKTEHRGFGFVTFETEASIQRVVAHGTHRINGSAVAIDIAMPKVEEGESSGGMQSSSMPQKNPVPGPVHFADPSLWMWPYVTSGGL